MKPRGCNRWALGRKREDMLTARGFWFLLTTLTLIGFGVAIGSVAAVLVCLTLLLWMLAHWFVFHWRFRAIGRHLRLERTLSTSRGAVESIWARERATVRVVLTCDQALPLPFVMMTDRVPAPARWLAGTTQAEGMLSASAPLEVAYAIECPGAGRLHFDGVRIQLADLNGLFYQTLFLRDLRQYRVLPVLPVDPAHSKFVKLQNTLPLVGTHRHPRPGSGSELFDLREYLPGDPPKMIAWKVSARRDRLMTRELESDVPIRSTLFVDTSNSVRVGPAGRTALSRLVEVAAGVAQANTAERDLTGLCLFDEQGVARMIRPGRGARHLWQILDVLTGTASLMPQVQETDLAELLPYGYGLAQDVYPDLLRADVNRLPWWLPIWSPQPLATVPRPAGILRGGPLRWLGAGFGIRCGPRRFGRGPIACTAGASSSPRFSRCVTISDRAGLVSCWRMTRPAGAISTLPRRSSGDASLSTLRLRRPLSVPLGGEIHRARRHAADRGGARQG